MKHYFVYVDGEEVGLLKARSHREAERKARQKYPYANSVSVTYTEI